MKNLIFIFILLLAYIGHCQSIVFEPQGIMDKPMPLIELNIIHNSEPYKDFDSKKKEGQLPLYVFSINEITFSIILKNLKENKTNNNFNNSESNEFGTYRIIHIDSGGNKTLDFILPSHKESYIFFKELLPLTSSNRHLYQKIESVAKRLESK